MIHHTGCWICCHISLSQSEWYRVFLSGKKLPMQMDADTSSCTWTTDIVASSSFIQQLQDVAVLFVQQTSKILNVNIWWRTDTNHWQKIKKCLQRKHFHVFVNVCMISVLTFIKLLAPYALTMEKTNLTKWFVLLLFTDSATTRYHSLQLNPYLFAHGLLP